MPDLPPLTIIYEDNHLLGVVKAGGVLVQGDRTRDPTLLQACKAYIKEKYGKPGSVYLGLVHRLDRPVSGVVLFARTSKAASRLVAEFRARRVEKTYYAVVEGRVGAGEGELRSYIERAHLKSRVVDAPSERAREALLTYRVLGKARGLTFLEVSPHTGRHHQIRLQLGTVGHPIVGDVKYGAGEMLGDKTIALHAGVLAVKHPTRDERVRLVAAPPSTHPWNVFWPAIEARFR